MALLIENWLTIEEKNVKWFLCVKQNSPAKIHQQVEVSMQTKCDEIRCEFNKGKTEVQNKQRSGQPSIYIYHIW